MPILFTCPHCGKQTSVADEFAGRSGPCAQCGKTITVPPSSAGMPPPPARSSKLLIVVIILAVVCGVLILCSGVMVALRLPAVQGAREAARRAMCQNNLHQICLALNQYESMNRMLPPVGATTRNGQPMMSWRVAILPYLEHNNIYQMYDRQQPWDSPKNRALAASMPPVYRCPSDPKAAPPSQQTSYVMIAGKNTVGGLDDGKRNFDYVGGHAGTSTTILVIEVPGSGIQWTDPRDLTIDEVIGRIKSANRGGHPGGVNVGFCDGHVTLLLDGLSPETLRALANPDNQQPVDRSGVD